MIGALFKRTESGLWSAYFLIILYVCLLLLLSIFIKYNQFLKALISIFNETPFVFFSTIFFPRIEVIVILDIFEGPLIKSLFVTGLGYISNLVFLL